MSNDIIDELGFNFINYAAAVNGDRSIPDACSGLKPVARRILYGAFETGRTSNKPYVKNARIVGDVMGALHPHGDTSIYGALVRIAQSWVMRYPLIDFHGNEGSINGDTPAAMRYTEGRLNKLAEEGMLYGLKKKNVPFVPNYDGSEEEPTTLPAIFPNLMCNPNSGIGVAMASNWGCNNLNEVEAAILMYLNGEEPTLPGPDFPTGGVVINADDYANIMKTGHGTIYIRAKYETKDNKAIITEIPYGVTIESILDQVGAYSDEHPEVNIKDVKDQTGNNGIKIVIECDGSPDSVMIKLFENTDLQVAFSYNQIALIGRTPTEMNLTKCCEVYVNHNIECLIKETQFDLRKALDRLHIINGLLIALEDIDNVIALIKKAESSSDAKTKLIAKYSLSEEQAKAILAMRLSSLAKLEKIELEQEKQELTAEAQSLNILLNSRDKQIDRIKERLHSIVEKYGDARRTLLMSLPKATKEKKSGKTAPIEIESKDVVVIMTKGGNIKRIPKTSFKSQNRATKGIKTKDDLVVGSYKTNTRDMLMCFSTLGKSYIIPVNDIIEGTSSSKGMNVHEIFKMQDNEEMIAVSPIYEDTNAEYAVFFTKYGKVKKTALTEYIGTGKRKLAGVSAIKLKDGDEIVDVTFVKDEDLMVFTKNGMSIKFNSEDISSTGKVSSGVKSIDLSENDYVLRGFAVTDDKYVLTISEKGLSKRTLVKNFTLQKRAGKGIKCYDNSNEFDSLSDIAIVKSTDMILIIGKPNSVCIDVESIRETLDRTAIGVMTIKDSTVDKVVKI